MSIRTRAFSAIAAGALVATFGLASASAGAVPPLGPGDEQVCTEDCASHPPDPWGPDDLATPPGDPDDGGDTPTDTPIPTNANFTG